MNILYHFRTRSTGAEGVHIRGIANAFEQLGHKVFFESPTGVDPRQMAGKTPFATAKKKSLRAPVAADRFVFELLEIGYNLHAWFKLRGHARRGRIDLIYLRHAFFLFATAKVARRHNIPLVVEVNELAGDERIREQPFFQRLVRWSDRVTFRQADLITVVSPHLKRKIVAMGIDEGKVVVLPNAIDPRDYGDKGPTSGLRKRWGFTEREVVFGFIGWFVKWHRLDFLLQTFAQVVAEMPDARLVFVGEGTLKGELEQLVSGLKLSDKVVFAGAVPHEDIPAAIAAFDVALVPHSNEYRSPIKLFEYMASGRAVLAPATEPIEMVVTSGANGLLFKPLDSADLKSKMLQLAHDPRLREQLARQGKSDAFEKYTWRHNAERIVSLLK